MKKEKSRKVFNSNELDNLVNDENSCMQLHRMKDHLALHPFHLNNLDNSVKEGLNTKIGKFCNKLDGILCGYKNIKCLSDKGYICDDSCFIHIDIEADFFIFKPTPQKVLKGIVNKISKDHVGCLVHNVFNVSLPKPRHAENWIGDSLTMGSEVEFTITDTNFESKLPYIKGEIISPAEDPVIEENENNLLLEGKKSKKKKAKKILFDSGPETEINQNEINENVDNERDVRKKRKSDKDEEKPRKKRKTD